MGEAERDYPYVSVADYLATERERDVRYEFRDGVVEAMSGASENHHLINGNLYGHLFNHLRGKDCTPFSSSYQVKIKSEVTERYYYPDLLVDCRERSGEPRYFTDEPKVLMEILSPSTMHKDMFEKLEAYKTIPSVEEILIISQSRPHIFLYRRENEWAEEVINDLMIHNIDLKSIDFHLSLREVYEGVIFPDEKF